MRSIRQNKRGQVYGIVLFFMALVVVLMAGFFMIFGSAILNWMADEIIPELQGISPTDDEAIGNLSEYSTVVLTPVHSVIESMTWMVGVIYLFGLATCFGIAFVFKVTGAKWLMGLFIGCAILFVLGSMFISNIYEDFANDEGELGSRLQEHTVLSFMILYSPVIFTIIVFISGIIMFTGLGGEEYA